MSRNRYTDDVLKRLTDDELTALYTRTSRHTDRIHILEELAERGMAWAGGMIALEREQRDSDWRARQHIVDLPGVSSGTTDPAEALEDIASVSPPTPEEQILLQMVAPADTLRPRPGQPLHSKN